MGFPERESSKKRFSWMRPLWESGSHHSIHLGTMVGIAAYFTVQTCLAVCNTFYTVKSGVSVAAQGASYMGIWTIRLQAAKLAHGLLLFAATIHDLVRP